jgi:hypothetical protein
MLHQEPRDFVGVDDMVHIHMLERAFRHRRHERIQWISHDRETARTFEHRQSECSVVLSARQDDTDHPRSVGFDGRPEQGIDRRAKAVLLRPLGNPHDAAIDQ